jgi:carboxypeptidase family protein
MKYSHEGSSARPRRLLVAAALLALTSANGYSQSISATLTGLVTDPTGAAVPDATVRLKNEQSGSLRETVTNAGGYYTFAAIAVGDFTYELTIETKGFSAYKAPGIVLGGGEKRNVNIVLKVGSVTETVEVTDTVTSIVPVDSGEKSATLSTKQLQNYITVGSNAASFIGILPGFSIQNGTSNRANFNGGTIGINANGDAGSQSPLNNAYSYNGLPSNSLDITADGAHTSDPGCNCDTPVNPNLDMISELKVVTSNFSAETQKGPAVVSSVAKSGGMNFHGSGFLYARHFAMNANDALNNASGVPRTENKYFYPGGTLGGPVLLPGTRFNKKREKLFFFTGYQYFYQTLDTGLLRATVPTPGMLQGNFSPSEIAKEGKITASGGPPGQLNAAALAKYPGGIIPASQLDPSMVNLAKLYPQPNADPDTTGGFNYTKAQNFNQNNVQWLSRVDYSISDNTKLFVRYNLQRETQLFPVGLWWRNTGQVPYPTEVKGKNRSDSVTASLTHVFSPSMTNEFVFGYTFIGFPNVFDDPKKVDRATVGYAQKGLYKNGVAQIPSFGQFGPAEAALVFNPGGFEAGGPSAGLYANKYMPSIADNLTKVWGNHTVKAGFFWEWIRNAQPANNNTNGQLQVGVGNPFTLGNAYADLMTGQLNSYNESSFNRLNDIAYNTYEAYIQDSWKVNKKLTLELGLRMTHFQPWYDRLGFGYSIFDYSQYKPTCQPTDYCGFQWHSRDSSVPLAGFPTRSLFYQPRFGMAYDVLGSGKTVIRGGWGRFYFHAGQFTNGLDVAAGVKTINLGNQVNGVPLKNSQLDTLAFTSEALSPAAVDSKDDKQAYTDSYSFTIAQRTPWSGLLEVAYVGNSTSDIPSSGNGGSLGFNTNNINLVPVGAMLSSANGGVDPNGLTANNFRPLKGFSDLFIATNNGYASYNSLQTTWTRSRGNYDISLNYTFGKGQGILGNYDQFNLKNNYGVLGANRTHVFNSAYSINLGNFSHDKLKGGFVNGWQVSGITQIQSGANLTANSSNGNFNLSLNGLKVPGTTFNVSNVSLLGTPNIQLNPVLTCDPTSNLGPHQYINPNCFAVPTSPGQNGPAVIKAIYGPAFFNTNLALFKNFQIRESMRLQFRIDGYNFLNHPLWSFNGNNLTLGFDANTGKLNTPNFGTVTQKQGNRVVQLAVKFYF